MTTTTKVLTKENIETMAIKVMRELIHEGMSEGVCIYYNNKRMTSVTDERETFGKTLKIEDGYDPHDYLEYAGYHHIMSMSFEGELYDYIDSYCEFPKNIEKIFNDYEVYFELGHMWDCTFYPIDDNMKVEYTEYKEPVSTTYLHLGDCEDGDEIFQPIMLLWKELSKKVGDVGSCTLGAGFKFNYNNKPYFMSPTSPYQGNISWETDKDKIEVMLKILGCTDIAYNWGNMD